MITDRDALWSFILMPNSRAEPKLSVLGIIAMDLAVVWFVELASSHVDNHTSSPKRPVMSSFNDGQIKSGVSKDAKGSSQLLRGKPRFH